MALLSCPTTRSSSVSKPCCPSWTQSLLLLLEAARAPSLRGASTHPASSSGWETDAFSHPAWSVTVCLASASSFPTPDVSTWCLSELCQDSSQQGIYLLLLLQRSLWCSVFYSFLPAPLFSSLHSPANPGFIFQFPSAWVLPSPSSCHLALLSPPLQHICIWPLPRSKIPQISFENIPYN